ncbi:relaxase/mobilization nuclease domain-containing protein [Pedobacter psychrodurus]|uniref:relaxase/mobilization nuclease domain-containing protein n=1 Tax=Pedobacter psychrodurus TaxID=2530456 RepID=UPI00292ED41B|nr:relaxase/mobilization nuclease domain-containing protein [Pedobacter psychrodurus]
MVARILTGESIRGLINYNESRVASGTVTPILASRFGLDIEQLELRHKVARFEHLTKLNSRVKTNAVHIMLNFHQSEVLPVETLQKIAVDYMDKIGFGDQPFLAYKHEDASHPHIHIVTTNMKADSTRIDMHNIGKTLSEKARKEIEIEYRLLKAEGRGMEQLILPANIEIAAYGEKQTKRSIYNVVTAVLRSYKFTSFAEYNAVLKTFNIVADRGPEDSVMFQKRGLVYSVLDADGNRIGIPFKASSFAGRPILNKVESKFARNLEKRKGYAEQLRLAVSKALKKDHLITKDGFVNVLGKQGISILFRENSEKRIYGITYIDHNSRCVFNGSDLGKPFSAKAILESFHHGKSGVAELKAGVPVLNKGKSEVSFAVENDARSSAGDSLLQFLFEKPVLEPLSTVSFKKKKKKKGRAQNRGLTN